MKVAIFFSLFVFSFFSSQEKDARKILQQEIIKEHLENGAWKHMLFSKEWQDNIDTGLKKDSTIAYLWQQKAMPLFKQRKYELGMPLIDKAVYYDEEAYLPYRAFILCIFVKNYSKAIDDFKECVRKYGNQYEMDHTYNFYIALCYLQLNLFDKAEKLLSDDIKTTVNKNGEDWVNPVTLFYYGIAKYEQQKWKEAIVEFDKALNLYPKFSDAKFYKAICLKHLNENFKANILLAEGKKDAEEGNTISESNAIYEKYPYQVIWR
ncbi:UNVERIFIED_CONTAM: tetratricopeptide repeat protein [Ralstonia mannitolilytica]